MSPRTPRCRNAPAAAGGHPARAKPVGMNEPEWVYAQRRQRAAVAVAMVIGAIVMIALFASTRAAV